MTQPFSCSTQIQWHKDEFWIKLCQKCVASLILDGHTELHKRPRTVFSAWSRRFPGLTEDMAKILLGDSWQPCPSLIMLSDLHAKVKLLHFRYVSYIDTIGHSNSCLIWVAGWGWRASVNQTLIGYHAEWKYARDILLLSRAHPARKVYKSY